jgi:hypothetical protein
MKKCSFCQTYKEEITFFRNKANKDGFSSICKTCEKEYKKTHKYPSKIKATYSIAEKEVINKKARDWYKNNTDRYKTRISLQRDRINTYKRSYLKKRLQEDPLFKLSCNLRSRISHGFRYLRHYKTSSTIELLGTDWLTVKTYIEKKFSEGMSWDNYGKWHIDHIIPLSSAKTKEKMEELCHYTNLQPLWARDNIIKHDKLPQK